MIVTRSNFSEVLARLRSASLCSLDTETFGLRPYHGDKLFSLVVATIEGVVGGGDPVITPYYFNFQYYDGLPGEQILAAAHLKQLGPVFADPKREWVIQNAKYDMAILANEGIELAGTIHCTLALARVEWNEYNTYDLDSQGERIGIRKDPTVEDYIKEHDLWTWQTIPGKKQRVKNKHYDRVPFSIIAPYGCQDTYVCSRLALSQKANFERLATKQIQGRTPNDRGYADRTILNIVENEKALTKVVFAMEKRGVLIDRAYTERAAAYETDRCTKALQAFKSETGKDLIASPKLFIEVFRSDEERWQWGEETKTGKRNPCFDSDVLKTFKNPAARTILDYRDAKSRSDFYLGFLYHADGAGVVHPNFNPSGARTARFSSSGPNLQNLTSESATICRACREEHEGVVTACGKCQSTDLYTPEFLVRRAIIPRPGHLFIMPDYDQMEYRMMLDYAQEHELIQKVLGGLDVHQATALMMGVTRKEAKTLNFMLLYGGGAQKLADALGISLDKAYELKRRYFKALPGVEKFIQNVINGAIERDQVVNWAGRIYQYGPIRDYAYTAPNTLIQGGTADVNKFGLVQIDKYLACKKSKLVLTIHDENPIECHEDEVDEVPRRVKEIMESIYPYRSLPLTVGMEWSRKSLGDKVKGFPCPVQ